ncbi:leucine-rich repeat-containing protein [Cavenderia fasciculata]|uniref:non-specific serine/threonine protein kinase n=1 Tax=Cavenderia fasciculata TaxID=261658 RepID=F4PKM0_CACFS|nr:leucine-rich repeat-containing protein [Cavenderia fasciculata]EGG24144.1 leucine-rich repeat-containing protein [Cavenderia fasciculata]|eukprot:XP_004361995.1 leucine-rich repeat-containing protein [Cavenderia fasciculata]
MMDILNLSIEFHNEGHITKRVVRIESTIKVGEVVRLLLDKFGKSCSDQEAAQFHLSMVQKNSHAPVQILSDINRSLQSYGVKNNDELTIKKRQKKNPAQAKLQKKKPEGIFKTLFSMSTLEMKLATEEKQFISITEVDGQIDVPIVLYSILDYLENHHHFNLINKDSSEISSSFQYYGSENEYFELLRSLNTGEGIDLGGCRNPKLLCNFLLYLLQNSLTETSLTYSLYTTFLKSATLESKSNIFYDIPPRNRVILKHIMLFLSKLTSKDPNLLDTISSIIAPFILGRIESPKQQQQQQQSNNNGGDQFNNGQSVVQLISNNRVLSNEETTLCKKVAIDLIQNISTYLLYPPSKGGIFNLMNGEKTIFSSENIYCIDKCNFPPTVASLGELWVTNYRIVFLVAHDNCEIPIYMIQKWKQIRTGPLFESYKIYCKDFRCKVIGFPANSPHLLKFKEVLDCIRMPTPQSMFAFANGNPQLAACDNFADTHLLTEYNRQGVSWDDWRTTNANSLLKVCDHYPMMSVVPKAISDNIVVTSAYYRSFRFPVLSWVHPTHKASITRAAAPEGYGSGGAASVQNSASSTTSMVITAAVNPLSPTKNSSTSGASGSFTIQTSSSLTTGASSSSSNNPGGPLISPRLQPTMSTSQMPQSCQEDVDLLKAIVDIKKCSTLSVYDTGSQAPYALFMVNCKIEFLSLSSPDKIRDSFYRILHLHNTNPDKIKWPETIKFNWINLLKPILAASIAIAETIEKGQPVLIQSRDESDSDAQLSSISQILLDSHYRTIEGFRTLVEKEWLCYGHAFARRSGHDFARRNTSSLSLPANNTSMSNLGSALLGGNSGNSIPNSQSSTSINTSGSNSLLFPASFEPDPNFSPIFMQFIFIVWQIYKEFPTAFEFNEQYLVDLIDSTFNCRFGTFLCNNLKERESIFQHTKSFWSHVAQNQQQYLNPLFIQEIDNNNNNNNNSPTLSSSSSKRIGYLKCNRIYQDAMWNEYFYRYCFKSMLAVEHLEERIRIVLDPTLNLTMLDLSSLRLYMLPESKFALRKMTNLVQLSLAKNNLNTIPIGCFSSMVNLEVLNLEENQIVSMSPLNVALLAQSLPNLTVLNLGSNQFDDLPMTLTKFAKLQVLSIPNNKFDRVPDVLDHLTTLVELDMSKCQVASIKIPLASKATLTSLNLSHTDITSLPEEIGELIHLENLNLGHNLLSLLPPTFANLSKLKTLSMEGNQFTSLPNEILQLSQLQELILENNLIGSLPSDINHLSNLRILNLRLNKLDILPASIGQLSNLTILNLAQNAITQLRPTMGLLSGLSELKLDGNPLRTPPPEILHQGLQAILDYLKDLIKGQEQCYRMKLMIVGQENVGKTTLLKTLRDRKKKPSVAGPNISTDGIVIDNWVFNGQFDDIDVDSGRPIKKKQDITLSVWDFAGQEIYYTTHQFFLSERSVYIVAWNIILEEEASRVEFWLQSITTRTKDAPIIIVGTHLDDSNKASAKAVKKKMLEKYLPRFPNIRAIKMVSCTNGKGISSLRETLEEIVQSQPTMGESLPRSYMLLENLVKEETKKRIIPTIPWQEFVQMGTICTITDEAELLRATMFLNQLGSLVYFSKELGLKQFVILDPQWITVMLSSIITTKHSYAKDGILAHKSLKQIWRPPQYPENLHPHLIMLLEKFEISYNLGGPLKKTSLEQIDENGQSLIPSLLPNERPASFASLWTAYNPKLHQEQFGRNYEFEFIPNGFFSRLMVRILNFAKTEARCYWRNGMLLQRQDEQIFIEMIPSRKLMCFTVRGKQSAQLSRDVIETIQSLLDDSFRLECSVYVPCIHCIKSNAAHPSKFSLESCENAAVKGIPYLKCQGRFQVRTDLLVPDLVMSNFTGSKISYSHLSLDELIGEGGAALVYRGRWKDQVVAIKKLKTVSAEAPTLGVTLEINDISLSKAFNEFRRECWVMSGIEHPNIVQLKGLCLDPLCIVTEYLPHGNLYKFLHGKEPVSWVLRLKIALDIASGMAFLHGSTPSIIHRDLKTPNILLASIDESSPVIAKVVDFGLSGLQHTITNRGVENPVWLAPEIIEKQEATTQSDIYAYGVILWELLTQKDYFGDLTFMSMLEDKVVNGERPEIPESCPPAYSQLVQDCWQNDPLKRPPFHEIEERILALVSEMFPNLKMVDPNEYIKEKRKSIRQHRKSISSNESKIVEEKELEPIKLITQSQEVNFFKDQNINNNNNNNNMNNNNNNSNHNGNNNSSPLSFYHNPKRSSVQVQPFFNEYKDSLQGGEEDGSVQCMITVNDNIWVGSGNGSITIWKQNGEKLTSIRAHEKRIHCLYPYMNTVWCGSADNNISIYNSETFTLVKKFTGHSPTCFTSVGHTMWVGSLFNAIHVWDIKKKIKYRNKISLEFGPVEAMLKRDNEVWVALSNNIARIDINSQRVTQMIKGHEKTVHCMIEVDGSTVWSCSSDGTIRIWGSQSGQHIYTIQAHQSRIFSLIQVGDYVWSGSWDCSIKIWSIKDYQFVNENRIIHKDAISSFILIQNNQQNQQQNNNNRLNRQVWSGSWDKNICIWQLNPLNLNSSYNSDVYTSGQLLSDTNSSHSSFGGGGGSSQNVSPILTSSNNNNNNNNNNSNNDLSTPSLKGDTPSSTSSSSLPPISMSASPSTSGGTLRSHARRTVSFVLDKINSNNNNNNNNSNQKK